MPIDSVEYKFNDKTGAERKAYFLTNFRDPGHARRLLPPAAAQGRPRQGRPAARAPKWTMSLEDRLLNGKPIVLGTSYRFYPGDTVTATLYHTEPAFYRFRQSVRDARRPTATPLPSPRPSTATCRAAWAFSRC